MVQYHSALEPLLQPIDDVIPHNDNYNNGDVTGIMDSIMESGMYRPIYVEKGTKRILAGNHTWMACKELGAEVIPVIETDAESMAAIKIMIGDNEYARHARPDTGQLVYLLEQLKLNQDTLTGTGISEDQMLQLQALNELPLDPDDGNHMQWPTLCFQIPPHVKRKFYEMTDVAGGDNERFQLILKLAGWDGKR